MVRFVRAGGERRLPCAGSVDAIAWWTFFCWNHTGNLTAGCAARCKRGEYSRDTELDNQRLIQRIVGGN
jgi:hypothetical protein